MKIQKHACCLIFGSNNKMLLLKHHLWNFNKHLPPGGKVDKSEYPLIAAIRETMEETRVKIDILDKDQFPFGTDPFTIVTDIVDGTIHQIYTYVIKLKNSPIPINTEPEKHQDLRWYSKSEILNFNEYSLGTVLAHINIPQLFDNCGYSIYN